MRTKIPTGTPLLAAMRCHWSATALANQAWGALSRAASKMPASKGPTRPAEGTSEIPVHGLAASPIRARAVRPVRTKDMQCAPRRRRSSGTSTPGGKGGPTGQLQGWAGQARRQSGPSTAPKPQNCAEFACTITRKDRAPRAAPRAQGTWRELPRCDGAMGRPTYSENMPSHQRPYRDHGAEPPSWRAQREDQHGKVP